MRTRIAWVIVASMAVGGVIGAKLLTRGHRPKGVAPSDSIGFPAPRLATVHAPSAAKPADLTRRAPSADVNWGALFASSRDYFAFVKRAAGPALHGDGAAALYVSRAVLLCQLQVVLYGHARDPRAALGKSLASEGGAPEFAMDEARRDFELCEGFFRGNAFASLPSRAGGYLSYPYWFDLAYHDHNPVAEVLHVAQELPALGNGTDRQTATRARTTLIGAVSSGNPEAVFRAGFFLLDGHGADVTDAIAITIAACHLGYDCTTGNPLIFGQCAAAGMCPAGEDYQDKLTQWVGPSGYAKAYAKSRQVEEAISQGNAAAIARFVVLRK